MNRRIFYRVRIISRRNNGIYDYMPATWTTRAAAEAAAARHNAQYGAHFYAIVEEA